MTSELKVLKQILEDDKRVPIQLVARQLAMGNDYIRYLCQELLRKGLVRKLEKRDCYEITQKGQQRFEAEEVEKSKTPRRSSGSAIKKYSAEKYIPPKKKTSLADSTLQQTSGLAGSPQAGSGQVKKKTKRKITKKVKRKSKKKTKKEVSDIQEDKTKIPVKLGPPRKRVIKDESKRKTMPLEKQLEKQSKKIIKVFKNLFHIKKS